MELILVWYFLTGGGGGNVATQGPFASQEQCEKMKEWAYRWRYTSECYQAPLAAPTKGTETCRAKTGCK